MTSEKNKKISIKQIPTKDTYIIRQPVLRKNQPISACVFPFDDVDSSFHLGLFVDHTLVGVVTYIKQETPLLKNNGIYYQLRGMAILESYQGCGYGKALIDFGEKQLKNNNINYIWCNARATATAFYKKNGFKVIGKPFDIPNIGAHFTMYKQI